MSDNISMSLFMPLDLHNALKFMAGVKGVSKSGLMRQILGDYIEQVDQDGSFKNELLQKLDKFNE